MRRSLRRIIFYSFVLAFAIAGPLVVAYSFGYTLNLSTASFESTGGVLVKSRTPRLSVFLDGSFLKETGLITGSMLVTNLEPGTHLIRLEKQGFHSWSKPVAVEPMVVTELRNVMLVPSPLTVSTSSSAELTALRATTTATDTLTLTRVGDLISNRGPASEKIAENVHSFIATEETVFFVDKNGFFARYERSSGAITILGRPGFFLQNQPLRFVLGQESLAILDQSGGLFLFRGSETVEPIAAGVKDAIFDDKEEKILLVKDQSIEIIPLKDNIYQSLKKQGGGKEIIPAPFPIRQAAWFYATNAHLVYRTGQGIFLTEIDGRWGRNMVELVRGATDELFTFSSLPNAVFYRQGKNIYKMEL